MRSRPILLVLVYCIALAFGIGVGLASRPKPQVTPPHSEEVPNEPKPPSRGTFTSDLPEPVERLWDRTRRDPAVTMARAEAHGPEAMDQFVRFWARVDPLGAAQFYEELDEKGQVAALPIVQELAKWDPMKTAEWIDTSVPDSQAIEAWNYVAPIWVQRDVFQLSEWLQGREPGAARDILARALCEDENAILRAPEATAKWASTITETKSREQSIRSVIEKTARQDYERAAALLSSAEISDRHLKQHLEDYLVRHRY